MPGRWYIFTIDASVYTTGVALCKLYVVCEHLAEFDLLVLPPDL